MVYGDNGGVIGKRKVYKGILLRCKRKQMACRTQWFGVKDLIAGYDFKEKAQSTFIWQKPKHKH